MEITPIGWLLIPLGIVLSITRPNWLYVLVIFFAPFSATSVLNRGSGEMASGTQPCMFLGFLLLLRKCADAVFTLRIRIAPSIRKPILLHVLFVSVCIASLAMPFVIAGQIEVMSKGTLDATLEPLSFKPANVTTTMGIVFGFGLTTLVAQRNINPQKFLATLRIYVISGIFVCLWGAMQFIVRLLGLPYPYWVFNNSASPYALGYKATLASSDIARVSSVTLEPSILAIVLLGMLPVLVLCLYSKTYLFGKLADRLVLMLLSLILFLTASTTGYIGVLVLILLTAYSLFKFGRLPLRSCFFVVIGILAFVAAYLMVPQLNGAVQETLLNKTESLSGLERGVVIISDISYFLRYPWLGVGWGSAPTHDLIFGILANCGLVGLASFLWFLWYITKTLRDCQSPTTMKPSNPCNLMLLSLLVTLAAYVVSGLPSGGSFWIILGLAISAVGQRGVLFPRLRRAG